MAITREQSIETDQIFEILFPLASQFRLVTYYSYFSGSMFYFGALFGAMAVGLIIDKYGRRPSFIFCIIPCTIGWLLIGISDNINIINLGTFLAGIIPGCIYIGQIYAAESIVVNHLHLRSSFSTWCTIALAIGILLCQFLGRIISYQSVALIAAAMAIISLMCICIFIPESPQWLYERGEIHRARLSERQLSIHQPVLKDFDPTRASVEFDVGHIWYSIKRGVQKLERKDIYKPLIILNVWFILVVFSGGGCIIAYQVNILNNYPVSTQPVDTQWFGTKDNSLLGYNLSIISAALTLVAVILTSILVTLTGIKKLFHMSSVGMAIGMAGLGASLYVDELQQAMRFWRLTHTSSVWLISFFYSLGVCTIPTSVIGDMFPHDAKGFASLPSLSYCGVGGILIKIHLYLHNHLGYLLYFIYASVNLLGVIFVQIFVPETVDKSQEEIGKYFRKS